MRRTMDPIDAERRALREYGVGPVSAAFHRIACHSALGDLPVDYEAVCQDVADGSFSLPPDPARRPMLARIREAVTLLL